ncbi:hypothetical protein P4544_09245 [Halomonas sp. LY9]
MNSGEKFIRIKKYVVPSPENSSEKEVYAFFGLASYTAQSLEKGLVTLAFSYSLSKRTILSEDAWGDLFSQVNRKTFGALLKLVKSETSIDQSMVSELDNCLSKRNWLAHDYFYDRAAEFCSEEGRVQMLSELSELIRNFDLCDQFITGVSQHIWQQHGITEADIDAAMATLVVGSA